MKQKWLVWFLFSALVTALLVISCAGGTKATPQAAKETTPVAVKSQKARLVAGSVDPGSAYFAWAAALVGIMNQYADVEVTLVVSGGGVENQKRVQDGVFDISLVGSVPTEFEAYYGMGQFEGKPFTGLRLLFLCHPSVFNWWVAQDTGASWLHDIQGKGKFCLGIPGSSVGAMGQSVVDVLGLKIDTFQASYADATAGIQDRRAIGMARSHVPLKMDPVVIEVHRTRPMTVVGLDEQEKAKVEASGKLDTFAWNKVVTGTHEAARDKPTFYQLGGGVDVYTTTKISQEVGYRIAKAVYENYEMARKAYIEVKDQDPIKGLIQYMDRGSKSIPLHAGLVQFAREAGINVPQYFIPPEYK